MSKMVLNPTAMIDTLTGNRAVTKPLGSVLINGEWHTIFVATDVETQLPRRNERGQVIFNVKPQR